MGAPPSVVVKKDMACTRAEMLAGLRRAFGPDVEAPAGGNTALVRTGAGALRVTMGPEQTRAIALLSITHMEVTLTFEGLDDAAVRGALALYDRTFQRGGG